jgi:hypothetical protein
VTFVVDEQGSLLVADRRSEHVACSGGRPVLSAGEMFFSVSDVGIEVVGVSNQSTGFCPEPESWPAIAAALDRIDIPQPGGSSRRSSSDGAWPAANGTSSRTVGSSATCAGRTCPLSGTSEVQQRTL